MKKIKVKLIDDIAIVGDVHGHIQDYIKLVKPYKYSVQVGDLGFNYKELSVLNSINHKWIPGNHDNYDIFHKEPHCLGNYGTHSVNGFPFFFIRGAHSVDSAYRIQSMMNGGPKCFWEQEILQPELQIAAIEYYKEVQPDIMITHTCPVYIARQMADGRNINCLLKYGHNPDTYTEPTQECLQMCLDIHQPKLWIFGHFHKSVDFRPYKYPNTRFICLDELEVLPLSKVWPE